MQLCLSVNPGFESAITIAPSKPILAEAAYWLMRNPAFDFPRCLLAELEHPGLDKGTRGEFIVMVLCLAAQDQAANQHFPNPVISVVEFIKELINPIISQ